MRPIRTMQGMALPTAIFLLVIMAALSVFMMRIAGLQQAGSAQDFLASRAFQAARAGMDWAAYQALVKASCSAASGFSPGGNLAAFTVSIKVNATSHVEAGSTVRLCDVTATACNQPAGGVCPGASGTPYYVERQLRGSFPY
jgi:MSHA biogenesis protein MshP